MNGFFDDSDSLDYLVLRPLAHIRPAWELTWDPEAGPYEEEPHSFAKLLNALISHNKLLRFVNEGKIESDCKVSSQTVSPDEKESM